MATPWRRGYYHLYFTDEKTEEQRGVGTRVKTPAISPWDFVLTPYMTQTA
jgi:hypothetical protein